MRVIQINTVCGQGSTGVNAVELANGLMKYGVETTVFYGQGYSSYENSVKFGYKIENHLHNLLSRIVGKQGYFSCFGTLRLFRIINKLNPDIIHLNNLHGNYININLLFRYISKKNYPVVWTLHDCWAFTGKCAHYADIQCTKWQKICHNCDKVNQYPPSFMFDFSRKMYLDKKRNCEMINKLVVVGVSKWIASEAKKSFMGRHKIQYVYNWVDQTKFHYIQEVKVPPK